MQSGYASKTVERERNAGVTAVLDIIHSAQEFNAEQAGKEPESPLTLALFRSRWLSAYSTPCHARGATFLLGSGYGE